MYKAWVQLFAAILSHCIKLHNISAQLFHIIIDYEFMHMCNNTTAHRITEPLQIIFALLHAAMV